ncbi:hypothetical protein MTO96_023908 [Rhipicephalus appendiculatus]
MPLPEITSKHFRVTENKVVPQAEDNGTLQNDTESEEIRLMAEILSSDSGFQSHPIFTRGSDFFACDEDDYALRQPEEYFSSYMDTSACKDVSPPVEQQSPFTKECSAIDASQIPMSDRSFHTMRHTDKLSNAANHHYLTCRQWHSLPDEGHFAATCSLSPESQCRSRGQVAA